MKVNRPKNGFLRAKCAWALLFLTFLAVVVSGKIATADDSGNIESFRIHRVLFISSYHASFPSFSKQIEGIREGFREAGFRDWNVSIDIEFMDSKRFPFAEAAARFHKALTEKLPRLPPYDVLLVGDDNALTYAREHADTLLKGIPVVFLSVNNRNKAESLNGNGRTTGVVEEFSLGESIEGIRHVYPDSKVINVIVDDTPTGRINHQAVIDEAQSHPDLTFRFIELGRLRYAEAFELAGSAPVDQPLLIRGAYRDATGRPMSYQEFLHSVRQRFSGPIFALQEHGIGHGVLGGKIVSHFEQGKVAARLASRVLRGEPIADIPVVSESPNVFVFDYVEMNRQHLGISDLPANSRIVNRPASLLDTNPALVIGAAAFLSLQMAIIVYLVFTVRRRRRAEAEMRQAVQAAERANSAKTEFLSSMSHELRTPLNSILGFSELIEKAPGSHTPEMLSEYAGFIRRGGAHLLDLINEVLDLARIEEGHFDLTIESFDPEPVVKEAMDMIRTSAEARGISVQPFEGVGGTFAVKGDLIKFRQVLLNLLSNAVKYNAEGGRVTLEAEWLDEGMLRFTVIDTGKGIDPENIVGLFQPFNRLGEEYGEVEGTGIGLTISKKLIELMGGRIGFESNLGRGSAFWVELPAWQDPVHAAADTDAVAEGEDRLFPGMKDVLYIEDNAANQRLMEATFSGFSGYRLRMASDGQQGLEATKRFRPDIILMDINLPGSDGIETAKEIRRIPSLKDVPIVAVSANAMRSEIERAREAGFDSYLTKPVDVQTLRSELETWLENSEPVRASA